MTKTYLSVATSLAKQAGEIMRKNFTLNMEKEWKGDRAPVTVTDTTINDIVLTTIKKEFPSHSILSEEGDDFSPESEFVWICDPVDGTEKFLVGGRDSVRGFKNNVILGDKLGNVYQVVQNRDAFKFFDAIVGEGDFGGGHGDPGRPR
jgi:myo-inositol-1(or 4)-monophosphatase